MSMMGELKFFLGLQIRQQKNGTFISQEKYLKDCVKKFGLTNCKTIKTPMPKNGHLDADEKGKPFDQQKYRSNDWFTLISMCISTRYYAFCLYV